MIRRTLRAEFIRQVRSPYLVILFGVLLVAWCIALVGNIIISRGEVAPLFAGQIIQSLVASLWPFLVLLHASGSLAIDRESGVLAFWLVSPISRQSLFFSRIVASVIFLMASIVLIHSLTWIFVIVMSPSVLKIALDVFLHSASVMAIVQFFVFLPLVSLGIFFSALGVRLFGTFACTIGLYFLLELFGTITKFREFVFTSYYRIPFDMFYDMTASFPVTLPSAMSWLCLIAWIFIPLCIGFVIFRSKDSF